MTDTEVWQLVLCKERSLRRLCTKYASSIEEADDFYSTCVIGRALDIMRTFDSERGTAPFTHLFANVKWYVYKEKMKRTGTGIEQLSERVHAPGTEHKEEAIGASVDLMALVAQLGDEHAKVVVWIEIESYTVHELASWLGKSHDEVKLLHREGMNQLKYLASGAPYGFTTGTISEE